MTSAMPSLSSVMNAWSSWSRSQSCRPAAKASSLRMQKPFELVPPVTHSMAQVVSLMIVMVASPE